MNLSPRRSAKASRPSIATAKTDRDVPSIAASTLVPTSVRPHPGAPLSDLSVLPRQYAMRVVGSCMEPILSDRCKAVFSKDAKWAVGDLVVIWSRPELPCKLQAQVKRLVQAPPHFVKALPFREHPESEIVAFIVVESINPAQRYAVRCCDLLGIHKLIAVVNDGAPLP
jgi:hypothetical protein